MKKDKYETLNNSIKFYLRRILKGKVKDNHLLDLCNMEMDYLYNKKILFIINNLLLFKNQYNEVNFKYNGSINNFQLLYELGLNIINPLEYNLNYELYNDKILDIGFINCSYKDFIEYIETYNKEFNILRFSSKDHDVKDKKYINSHFIVLPKDSMNNLTLVKGKDNRYEVLEDYHMLEDDYIILTLHDIKPLNDSNIISIDNVIITKEQKEFRNILKPVTFEDYIKVLNISYGNRVWNDIQKDLFMNHKITINNLITCKEDVFDYLIKHKIDRDKAIEITNFIGSGKYQGDFLEEWLKYRKIMDKNHCDLWFYKICSEIRWLPSRGRTISDCLYALDKNNYKEIV